jgi:hypothetical protein
MPKHDEKTITKTDDDTKEKKEDARHAAREFWDSQRLNQTNQPQPTPRRSMRM